MDADLTSRYAKMLRRDDILGDPICGNKMLETDSATWKELETFEWWINYGTCM